MEKQGNKLINLITTPLDIAERAGVVFGCLAIWCIVVVVFGQVFARYVLRIGLPWPDELARYLHISIVFLGLAYGFRNYSHIRVDFFYERLNRHFQTAIYLISNLLTGAMSVVIVMGALQLLERIGHSRTAALGMPLQYFFLPVLIGFMLVALESLRLTILGAFKGERFQADVEESEVRHL